MTIQETSKLLYKIGLYYSKFCEGRNEEELENIIECWHELLYDLPFKLCLMALKKHVLDTEKGCFVPSVGEIRKNAMNICDSDTELTGSEAWGEVTKAIGKYGHYRVNEALESMTEITRKVVQHIGYREIYCSKLENTGVIRGQFLKMYEQFLKRENQKKLMPKGFMEKFDRLLGSTQCKMINEKGME